MTEMNLDTPITLEHSEFVDYAFAHWLFCLENGIRPKTMCLLGPPGIGKSSAAYSIQEKMTAYVREHPELIFGVSTLKEAVALLEAERTEAVRAKHYGEVLEGKLSPEDYEARVAFVLERQEPLTEADVAAFAELLDFSSKLPEDLGGLPFRSADGFTDYCPQRWVAKLCGKYSFGVYVQDDLPAAPQAMQVAGRQSALENRIHQHRFADGVLVMVTGNRREDKASAGTLPSHFRNSVTLLSIEPSLKEWKAWYGKQKAVDPVVPAFLSWKPDYLSQTPGESKDKLGAFATPRQWFSLGQQFRAAKGCGDNVLDAVAAGLVGRGIALEFCGFVEIRSELPPPEKVLDDPKTYLAKPREILNEPSKRCAMATALGEHAAARWKKLKGEERNEVPGKLLTALAWAAEAGDEYSAVGVQTFLDQGGNLTAIARMARAAKGDPVVGRLLDHVKRALLPKGTS